MPESDTALRGATLEADRGDGQVADRPQNRPATTLRDDHGTSPESKPDTPKSPKAQSGPTSRPTITTFELPQGFLPQTAQDGSYSSWSASSDKQMGYCSPGPNDRVFPIRSVISVDPTQTPLTAPHRNSIDHDGFPGMRLSSGSRTSMDSDRDSTGVSERTSSNTNIRPDARTPISSARNRKGSVSADHSEISALQLFSDNTSETSKQSSMHRSTQGHGSAHEFEATGAVRDDGDITGHITARFKHVVTEQGHAVITGRDGEVLQRCEDEPIHIPGAVQGFGLIIGLREEGDGELSVRMVSENSQRIIGFSPEELFRLSNFTDIFSDEQADNLLDHVDFIKDEEADPATNGPEVFTVYVKSQTKRNIKLWCAMHVNPSSPEIVICEFELDDDPLYPLVPANEGSVEPPEDTLNSDPTPEEFTESTHNASKPLRVLRTARKRKGEAAAMEVFNIMSQIQEQMANAPNLDLFLKILVGVVKELTGFHRVMIYQFDAAFNGRVVTELVDPRATRDFYKGLNFPASDIPKQARDLYKVNKVRLLYDRDVETARIICRTLEDLKTPLDLSFSYLRAMSPIHIKYLTNMAVRSSMSISITAFGELWGLIACHSYGARGMRVSFPIRKMCRLVGDSASRNIERLSYASRLQARKLINTMPTDLNPSGYIIATSDDLLTLFDADFGLLSIRGETKILGKMERSQEALAMLEYLKLRNITSVITSQDITEDFPDLRYPPGFQLIAGLLLVPLSVGGADFIVFFRKGQIREVKWAGNPYEKFLREGTEGYLEPRKSFKTWSETVIGKCREWTEEQIETSAVLCLVYGKFIEVWRQKEAALQSSELTKLLLANSAHEVRTPLNAIINYLEIALEGSLDQETRENLAKSHSASKSLIYVINDLLDLTNTEEGQELIKDEVFDLPATIREATDNFKGDARRKGMFEYVEVADDMLTNLGIEYELIEHPGVPQMVHGDSRRVRQAIANMTANAVQHTKTGWVHIEIWLAGRQDSTAIVEIIVQDTGCGMSNQELDALFRDLEQVTTDADSIRSAGANDESTKKQPSEEKKKILGLGLAMVARTVRNMGGQLRLKSEKGQGSRFIIQLSFEVEEAGDSSQIDASHHTDVQLISGSTSSLVAPVQTPPLATEGELLLVTSTGPENITRRRSLEDVSSISSVRSGSSGRSQKSNKSDVDRLIDAISEPLRVGSTEPSDVGGLRAKRSNSRGSAGSKQSAGSLGSIGNAPVAGRPTSLNQMSRPNMSDRSKSLSTALSPAHLRTPLEGSAGFESLPETKTPIRAVRMPDEFSELQETIATNPQQSSSRVLFDLPDDYGAASPRKPTADHLQVLVAEDDPINSKIIIKRLEKLGHDVFHTVNGEECATAYADNPAQFDVILMDMQMPIVDGLSSTKLIRSYEKIHKQTALSPRAATNGRAPIFAVSASLVERERQVYIDAGFDGWILKPIDFKRLNVLFAGIVDEEERNDCLYQTGRWERGGWFQRRQPNVLEASTSPSNKTPVKQSPEQASEPRQPDTEFLQAQDRRELDGSSYSSEDSLTPGVESTESRSNNDEGKG